MEQSPVILLVEDLDSDAQLIERAFRKANVRNPIVRLSRGTEAISYLVGTGKYENRAEYPLPVFVLLDINLPDLSGYDVLVRVRTEKMSLPIVIVTASEDPHDAETAQALGANAFFRKRLDFEDLVELVRSVGAYWNLRTE